MGKEKYNLVRALQICDAIKSDCELMIKNLEAELTALEFLQCRLEMETTTDLAELIEIVRRRERLMGIGKEKQNDAGRENR